MKKAILVLIISIFASQNLLVLASGQYRSKPYKFDGRLKTRVVHYDSQTLKLKVIKNRDKPYSYPVGTVFTGHVIGHKNRRRLSLDEVEKVQLDTATLPGGRVHKLRDKKIKIKPEDYLNYMWKIGGLSFLTAGVTLGIVADVATLGLPIGRGGFAAWYSVYQAYESPEEKSKLKEGVKGFFQGALFPLPQVVMKGDELDVHNGSIIYLGKEPRRHVFAKTFRFFNKIFLKDKTPYIKAALIKKFN